MLRAELEPIHDRLDRVEAEAPRGHQQDIPNRQQGGRVPWRNVEEEAESEFDEPYLNRGRFQRANENREARMGRPRRDNDLGNIKVKVILKFIWSRKLKWRWCLIVTTTRR